MQTTIQKWGNSLAVRIPLAFAAEAKLTEDSSVDISVENGKLIVARKQRAYRLADLLDGMTKDNAHAEEAIGHSVGGEAW